MFEARGAGGNKMEGSVDAVGTLESKLGHNRFYKWILTTILMKNIFLQEYLRFSF